MTENGNVPHENGDVQHHGLKEGHRDPAPPMPLTHLLSNSVTHYVPRDDGGMVLVFTPGIETPTGQMALMPPQFQIMFNPDGWERFKNDVANDGVRANIAISRVLPPMPPSGRRD